MEVCADDADAACTCAGAAAGNSIGSRPKAKGRYARQESEISRRKAIGQTHARNMRAIVPTAYETPPEKSKNCNAGSSGFFGRPDDLRMTVSIFDYNRGNGRYSFTPSLIQSQSIFNVPWSLKTSPLNRMTLPTTSEPVFSSWVLPSTYITMLDGFARVNVC